MSEMCPCHWRCDCAAVTKFGGVMASDPKTERETLIERFIEMHDALGGSDGRSPTWLSRKELAVALASLRAAPAPTCVGCNGKGVVGDYVSDGFCGSIAVDVPCPDCRGRGAAPEPEGEPPCADCTRPNSCRFRGECLDHAPASPAPTPEKVYHHNIGGKTGCGVPLVRGNSMPELNHVTCEECQKAWHGGTLPTPAPTPRVETETPIMCVSAASQHGECPLMFHGCGEHSDKCLYAQSSPEPAQDGARETTEQQFDGMVEACADYQEQIAKLQEANTRLTSLLAQAEQERDQAGRIVSSQMAAIDLLTPALAKATARAGQAEAESARLVARLAGALSPKADA